MHGNIKFVEPWNSTFLLKIFFSEKYHSIKNALIYKVNCNLKLPLNSMKLTYFILSQYNWKRNVPASLHFCIVYWKQQIFNNFHYLKKVWKKSLIIKKSVCFNWFSLKYMLTKKVCCFNLLPWTFTDSSHWEVFFEINLIKKTLKFYIFWVHWKNQCRSIVRKHALL